ncbi:hypothetical protein CFOL_v3_06590 [Cephalotus follicularis]|uniref:Uncharacterized protein n=1 Tax=Cephalotus follicularis TaxID=3775 RepID=A0A1Q3B4Z5_CEPFO|nr:hypothetical protein CFOL_v3_06590 [Cephalotus follicularis]
MKFGHTVKRMSERPYCQKGIVLLGHTIAFTISYFFMTHSALVFILLHKKSGNTQATTHAGRSRNIRGGSNNSGGGITGATNGGPSFQSAGRGMNVVNTKSSAAIVSGGKSNVSY